ncbi:MAG: carbamoyltransferase HypF, partial [Verrucomicrobiales bacterium]|nr:carbamoyltransferase HypF [Verrucomicrobiales bacterium]
HHLLMDQLGFPVVATSGNLGEEPICRENGEAVQRLGTIADGLLVHDRTIVRSLDDSVMRMIEDQPLVMRHARGFAPTVLRLQDTLPSQPLTPGPFRPVLGVGAHWKGAVALADGELAVLGPHVGDLETAAAGEAHRASVRDLEHLYSMHPVQVACDGHPDYTSTRYAEASGLTRVTVQHHYAHILSCLAEHRLRCTVLGVAWDGAGDGMDGTVWGGEFLRVSMSGACRVAWMRPFLLPGSDAAAREPRRAALAVLRETFGAETYRQSAAATIAAFSPPELDLLESMMARGVHCPRTTSVGRLFDAVASILGLRQVSGFEGDAAMAVEFATEGVVQEGHFPYTLSTNLPRTRMEVDWRPTFRALLAGVMAGESTGDLAAKFHNTLAEILVGVALSLELPRVVLTGGCFQNRRLTEAALRRLRERHLQPICHRMIPPNDGGIALGQVVAALREQE